jgi:hypothetical protein
MSWWVVITSAAVGLAAVGTLLWFWWWRFPKRQVDRLRLTIRDPKARAEIEDNLRKTIGQLIGGTMVLVGAGVGAVIAYLQLSQQQQASRDLLISTQVSKGFEQLGSDKPVVQLGGIYALEGVMKTSEQYHQPVLEALCAFVRDRTKTDTGDGPPVTEIQAALTVIGRRKVIGREGPDLSNAHIPQARLRDADLRETDLTGANLSGANLSGAVLNGADLSDADLRHADLSGADLSYAHLSHADLDSVHLDGADLRHAAVTQAQLEEACGKDVKLDPGLTIKPCP